jgi:hypothetical protein
MTSGSKITIEADLGKKGVEKTDVYVYKDGRLLDTYFDRTFDDIRKIAREIKEQNKEAEVDVCCIGEDCAGGFHRWAIDD